MKKAISISLVLAAMSVAGSNVANAAQGDTLKNVRERGVLNCTTGDGNYPGFFEVDEKGKWHGIDTDYCRAVATAIFGDDSKLKLIPTSWAQRFPSLQSGALDVVVEATGWTMGRDTELGLQFSTPYFVGATSFMTHKDLQVTALKEMAGGTVCVAGGTSQAKLISDYLKQNSYAIKLVTFEKDVDALAAYMANRCDSYADFAPALAASASVSENPDDHVILSDVLSLEPIAAAMRQGDDAWVDLVNWVIGALLLAEENGVNSANVEQLKANPPNDTVAKLLGVTPGIGERLNLSDDWVFNVVKEVGNTEEIYKRNIGADSRYKLPRGLNAPWQKGGVFFPPLLD